MADDRSLVPTTDGKRTVTHLIDEAIEENKAGTRLIYILSTLVVLTGLGAACYGLIQGRVAVSICGTAMSFISIPGFHYVMKVRKENVEIRLLEGPLIGARTPEEAMAILRRYSSPKVPS